MRKKWYFMVPIGIVAITLFMFLGGEVVMHLWNWLLPPLFGWHTLTFWQALGLLVLAPSFGRLVGTAQAESCCWRRRRGREVEHHPE